MSAERIIAMIDWGTVEISRRWGNTGVWTIRTDNVIECRSIHSAKTQTYQVVAEFPSTTTCA